MTNGMLTTVLGLGFVLGLRHALDPDHLVAVSTIVGECRSVKKSSLIGTFWGLGHTVSLPLVGRSKRRPTPASKNKSIDEHSIQKSDRQR